ncbi:TPA: hypothetical protein ACH3X1_000550 [Trebouxia sp. C0004]
MLFRSSCQIPAAQSAGLIEDFGLFFPDVDMLGSKDLDNITSCFECQIADATCIASIHANDEEHLRQPLRLQSMAQSWQ